MSNLTPQQQTQADSLKARGYRYNDHTRLGYEFVRMDGDKMVHKAVIDIHGNVKHYLPTLANKYQRQAYS